MIWTEQKLLELFLFVDIVSSVNSCCENMAFEMIYFHIKTFTSGFKIEAGCRRSPADFGLRQRFLFPQHSSSFFRQINHCNLKTKYLTFESLELRFHLLAFANWYKNTFAILVASWLYASLASVIVEDKVNIMFLSVRWKITLYKNLPKLGGIWFIIIYHRSRLLNLNYYYHFYDILNCK